MNKQKVLVLGGTGAIGAHLVDCLKETKYEVVVTSRRERQSDGNVFYVKGNAHDLQFLCSLLTEHYEAIVNFMTYQSDEFEKVAHLLLKATDQYFFLSSCRSYAGSDEVLTEESPLLLDVCKDNEYLATDNYALAKARQERILRRAGKTNWTIVRPYLTYSEQRLQLGFFEQNSWLLRALMGRKLVFSEELSLKYTTLTYGKDVARAICSLIGKEEAYGEAINICCKHSLQWKDVLDIYSSELESCLNKQIQVVMLPKAPVDDWPTEKWTYLYDRNYNRCFSNEKLISIIGDFKFTEPEEGLRHCIREFVKNPNRNGYSWGQQACFDRMTGEWAHRKEIASFREYLSYLKNRVLSGSMKERLRKVKSIINK